LIQSITAARGSGHQLPDSSFNCEGLIEQKWRRERRKQRRKQRRKERVKKQVDE
jgi:hypothetical protein